MTLKASLLRDLHMKDRGFRGSQRRTATEIPHLFFFFHMSYIRIKTDVSKCDSLAEREI